MTSGCARRIGLLTLFILFSFSGCKSTVNKVAVSTCKAVETNIAKCSGLIANDVEGKNINIPTSVNEGDL